MKMKNKKFIAVTSALGLTAGLLSGCGTPTPKALDQSNQAKKTDEENGTSGGSTFVPAGSNNNSNKAISSSKSSSLSKGSSGIGSGKGGSAGS